MTGGRGGRTAPCTPADARARLAQARAYLATAELVEGDEGQEAWADVAAGCAVLAGIAASDTICCATIGVTARGQDHSQAVDMLRSAIPDGAQAAQWLRRLLDLKGASHYGVQFVSPNKARAAIRQAQRLVARAEDALTP